VTLVDTHITVTVIDVCSTDNSIELGSWTVLSGTQTFYKD